MVWGSSVGGCAADAGGAAGVSSLGNPHITEMSITAAGLPFTINDAPTSGPYHQLAIGADVLSGGALISYSALGGASPLPLSFNVNGVQATFSSPPGTVTSVGLSVPSILSVSPAAITTSGVFTLSLTSQTANTVFAAPNGSGGTPAFRSLVPADMTGLAASATTDTTVATNISSGTLPAARLPGPGASTLGGIQSVTCGTSTFISSISTAGVPTCTTVTGTSGGTVTTFSASVPSYMTESVANPTTTPALTLAFGTESANQVFAGPSSGSAAAPGFRSLVGSDLPAPTASSLGGVESGSASSSQVMLGISTAGAPQFGAVPVGALPTGCAGSSLITSAQNNATTSYTVANFKACTPSRSGTITIGWSGSLLNTVSGYGATAIAALDTNSPSLGGSCGLINISAAPQTNATGTASAIPLGGSLTITGLSQGTTYYVELCFESGNASGNARIVQSNVSVVEQ